MENSDTLRRSLKLSASRKTEMKMQVAKPVKGSKERFYYVALHEVT